jgi:hypothetical protein
VLDGSRAACGGFALAGALVFPAESQDEARAAWSSLPADGRRPGPDPTGRSLAGYGSVVAPGRAAGGDAAMSDEVERAFAPVRACLLCGAQAKASRILAEALEQADSILRQARRGAAEVVDRAQTRGKADAAAAATAERTRARDQARSLAVSRGPAAGHHVSRVYRATGQSAAWRRSVPVRHGPRGPGRRPRASG